MAAVRPSKPAVHRPRRGPARPDDGISVLELAITLGILGVMMAMVLPMVLTFNRMSMSAQWRSEANTALRPLVEEVFAELRSARSLPTCAAGQTATVSGTARCLRPVDNGAPVLSEATPSRLCFISQRRSVALAAGDVLTAPAYTCLEVSGTNNAQFRMLSYPPSTTGYALGTTATTGTPQLSRTLGTIQAGATPFTYQRADGTATTALGEIAVVGFGAELSRWDGVRTDTQRFSYRIALRPQSYRAGG